MAALPMAKRSTQTRCAGRSFAAPVSQPIRNSPAGITIISGSKFTDIYFLTTAYRVFYLKGHSIEREEDLQILYRLTWRGTSSDVNREVNNGRGPVDYKVSRGGADKTLVEFKLATNSQLKRNLANQVAIYEKANDTKKSIKVIIYFTRADLNRVQKILRELKLTDDLNIVLIDARRDNKPSASKA